MLGERGPRTAGRGERRRRRKAGIVLGGARYQGYPLGFLSTSRPIGQGEMAREERVAGEGGGKAGEGERRCTARAASTVSVVHRRCAVRAESLNTRWTHLHTVTLTSSLAPR